MGEGGGAGDITLPCQGSGMCPPSAAGELRAQQGQGFQLKPPTSFVAASVWKRNPLPASVAGAGTKPCMAFHVAEHHPGDSCPHPLRMWGSHPSWRSKRETTQPGGGWEVDPETPPKCSTWLPCSQPPAQGGRDAALAHLGCSLYPSATHWDAQHGMHPKAVLLAGARPAPAQPQESGGRSRFICTRTFPQQEAGAPAGLAPRQHRGGRSETANKEQNLPF